MRRALVPIRSHSMVERSGFTLVEIVVAVVLLGILGIVGSRIISDSVTTANISTRNQANISQARYAIERIARELREVRITNGLYEIDVQTNPSQLAKFTKSNGQAVCVEWTTGNTLQLAYAAECSAAPQLLTNQASAFSLSYLNISGTTTLVDQATIRFVEIDLATSDPATGVTTRQRTRVGLRNFPGV